MYNRYTASGGSISIENSPTYIEIDNLSQMEFPTPEPNFIRSNILYVTFDSGLVSYINKDFYPITEDSFQDYLTKIRTRITEIGEELVHLRSQKSTLTDIDPDLDKQIIKLEIEQRNLRIDLETGEQTGGVGPDFSEFAQRFGKSYSDYEDKSDDQSMYDDYVEADYGDEEPDDSGDEELDDSGDEEPDEEPPKIKPEVAREKEEVTYFWSYLTKIPFEEVLPLSKRATDFTKNSQYPIDYPLETLNEANFEQYLAKELPEDQPGYKNPLGKIIPTLTNKNYQVGHYYQPSQSQYLFYPYYGGWIKRDFLHFLETEFRKAGLNYPPDLLDEEGYRYSDLVSVVKSIFLIKAGRAALTRPSLRQLWLEPLSRNLHRPRLLVLLLSHLFVYQVVTLSPRGSNLTQIRVLREGLEVMNHLYSLPHQQKLKIHGRLRQFVKYLNHYGKGGYSHAFFYYKARPFRSKANAIALLRFLGTTVHFGRNDFSPLIAYLERQPEYKTPTVSKTGSESGAVVIDESIFGPGTDFIYENIPVNAEVLKLRRLVEINITDPEFKQKFLSQLNNFFSHYYGLYYLIALMVKLNIEQYNLILHGGTLHQFVIDSGTIIEDYAKILATGELSNEEKYFAIGSLFTTDLDYIGIQGERFNEIRQYLLQVVKILNLDLEEIKNLDQYKLFNDYFVLYYFGKNCPQRIQFLLESADERILTISFLCANKTYRILDVTLSVDHQHYPEFQQNPLAKLLIDYDLLFKQLKTETDVSPHKIMKHKKRLFRFNYLMDQLRQGNYNYRDTFMSKGKLENGWFSGRKIQGIIKSLLGNWANVDPKFLPDFFLQTPEIKKVQGNRRIPTSSDLEGYLEKIRFDFVGYRPTLSPILDYSKIQTLIRTIDKLVESKGEIQLPNSKVTLKEAFRIMKKYTSNYYHYINSCLFNYIYQGKCNPKIAHECQILSDFCRFVARLNPIILGKDIESKGDSPSPENEGDSSRDSDSIVLYRTENDVSLGLPGSYSRLSPGNVFVNSSFWSTSYSKTINLGNKKILLEITLDISAPYFFIGTLSNSPSEDEVLIPFGEIFEVTGSQFVMSQGQKYLLVKLRHRGSLQYHSLRKFVENYHKLNYAGLPRENRLPKDRSTSEYLSGCKELLRLPQNNYHRAFQAEWSRTLPVHMRFQGQDYVLKFYFYRKTLNGIDFPNNYTNHPLDIELFTYRLTERVAEYSYVTPNLLREFPDSRGYCNFETALQIVDDKKLCPTRQTSWLCNKRPNLEKFLARVPYRLLEYCPYTAEYYDLSQILRPFDYVWQVFYSVKLLHDRFGFVHFDLKPGNIFLTNNASNNQKETSVYQYYRTGSTTYYEILVKTGLLVKIADYDASFLRMIDNIFISRDDYHKSRIAPLKFRSEEDRAKIDVKLFFELAEEMATLNSDSVNPEWIREFRHLERLSFDSNGEPVSLDEYLDILVGYDESDGGVVDRPVPLSPFLGPFEDETNVYSNYWSDHYSLYLPPIQKQDYPVVDTDNVAFIERPFPIHLNHHNKSSLRVMTYNVHEFKDRSNKDTSDQIWQLIRQTNPDILFLQEVTIDGLNKINQHLSDYGASGLSGGGQIYLSSSDQSGGTILEAVMAGQEFTSLNKCKADVHLYNAIFFKNTISNLQNLWEGKIKGDDRCAQILLIDLENPKYRLLVVGTHFTFKPKIQTENWDSLKKRIDQVVAEHHLEGVDIIFAGDLNSYQRPETPEKLTKLLDSKRKYYREHYGSKSEDELAKDLFGAVDLVKAAGFTDTYDLYQIQHGLSLHSPESTTIFGGKIDHIFVNKCFSQPILGCYQIVNNLSDHTPLVVDIGLRPTYPQPEFYQKLQTDEQLSNYLKELLGRDIENLEEWYPEWLNLHYDRAYLEENRALPINVATIAQQNSLQSRRNLEETQAFEKVSMIIPSSATSSSGTETISSAEGSSTTILSSETSPSDTTGPRRVRVVRQRARDQSTPEDDDLFL